MKKRYWIPLAVVLVIFLALHFALEPVVLRQVNKALANMEGMHGEVRDVNIRLFRGAYQVDSLYIFTDEQENREVPFFAVQLIDVSVDWGALFKGEIVADVQLQKPILNYVFDGEKVDDGDEADLGQLLEEMTPFKINTFAIQEGEIHYLDYTSSPNIDIFMKDLSVMATNLGNIDQDNSPLPSSVSLNGTTIGGGVFQGHIDMNILKEHPDFDLSFELDGVDLNALNDFTEAYAKFEFEAGQLYAATEIVMKDGVFEGYLKPIFENVEISDHREEDKSFWRRAWEKVVGVAFNLFENPDEEQVATKIPFEGNTTETEAKIIPTVFNVFRNAFIEAFSKDLDHELHFENK
jgi:hypothetical protein